MPTVQEAQKKADELRRTLRQLDRIVGQTTVDSIAADLGVSRQTVQEWFRRGCPRDSAEAVKEWRDKNIQARKGGPQAGEVAGGSLQERKTLAEIAKIDEEVRRKRLQNDELEGELVYREAVELDAAEMTGMIRARLESIPQELESEWPAEFRALITERLQDRVRLILTEMSHWKLGGGNV